MTRVDRFVGWAVNGPGEDYRPTEMVVAEFGPEDVLIEPVASALNHMDLWLLRGRPSPPSFPHAPGGDGAGIVRRVGDAVRGLATGDEVIIDPSIVSQEAFDRGIDAPLDRSLQVLGEHRWGTHAGLVCVPARHVARKPPNRTWTDCAALPVAYVTAWRMMKRARVAAGDRVLIVGIGGGVATASLSIARHLGAEVVVTSSSADKRQRAEALGASAAVPSDGPFPKGMDVVVESVGPATWESSVAALRPGGRMVVCGGTSGPLVEVNLPRLFFKQTEIIGSTMGSPPEFAEMVDAFAAGLEVVVDSVVGFEDYPAALELLRSGKQLGKIVIDHSTRASLV
jgi:NADPH:quinone reductase-like Zn-dependent oxidoreductase